MTEENYPVLGAEPSPCLYVVEAGDSTVSRAYSRAELAKLRSVAIEQLRSAGLVPGDRFLLCMDANRVQDLVWRAAAAVTRTIPVTVNWQADSIERIHYKMERTEAKAVVVAPGFLHATNDQFLGGVEGRPLLSLDSTSGPAIGLEASTPNLDDIRIIIFTSGTTGDPKPVALSYGAYRANQQVFESFLNVDSGEPLTIVVSNPLHHANSTAVTDWAMRRKGTRLFLFERFSRSFWHALVRIVEETEGKVLVPAVSRHFDLLESLAHRGELGIDESRVKAALSRVTFLVGSAPVGPSTVQLFKRWTGKLPVVRFGSTELCLQALGIPTGWSTERTLEAFTQGWEHEREGVSLSGFLIGRPHPPWTEALVVGSVDSHDEDFMVEVPDGQLGRLVVRSDCAFTGYWGDEEATDEAMFEGWYLSLGDHGFAIRSPTDGERDFYWVGRDAGLMIRGGANYSCQQVAGELRHLLEREYCLDADAFDIAVIGLKLESEHEDTCCVMVEVASKHQDIGRQIEREFVALAGNQVSKGARPDRLVVGKLPRNFKGALDVRALSAVFTSS